jgi:pimeloyl-ACP methyl ester carboxylesterase
MMAEPKETTLKLDGCDLFVRRAGNGPPLLFLHGARGFPGWLPFFQSLSERFDVIVPDHPGFGRSSVPDWLDDVGDLAYFYQDLLAHLNLSSVHLVGHSIGGWMALEIAVRSTQRLKTLTLINSAGIRIKGKPIANIFIMDREESARAAFADPKLIAAQLDMPMTPELQETMVKNQAATARLAWQPRLFNPKLHKWLHRVTIPTLIVWGDKDGIIPPDYAAAFNEAIAGSRVTMVPGVAHSPHVENPAAVLDAITKLAAA